MNSVINYLIYFWKQGTEYDFVEDWGEQLIGKSQPVICVYNVNWEPFQSQDPVQVLDASDEWSPGQVNGFLFFNFLHNTYTILFLVGMVLQSTFSWCGLVPSTTATRTHLLLKSP